MAEQLGRYCVAIEIDPAYVQLIRDRLEARREADSVLPWRHYYRFTPKLDAIWISNPATPACTAAPIP